MKRSTSTGTLISHDAEKYKKPKPRFDLTEDELPDIKDWTVGKKYKLVLSVEMVSQSKGREWDRDDDQHRASFQINRVSPQEEPKKDK